MSKVVLVSGGSRGIGKAVVEKLLDDGFKVFAFSQNPNSVSNLTKEILSNHSEEVFASTSCDVTEESSVKNLIDKVIDKFGTIDILINNAGVGYFTQAETVDMNRFSTMMSVNMMGVANLTKHVVPIMKARKEGLIINISSISGKTAFAYGEFYSATKFAVMGYSQAIRAELKDFGIKVATVCPGMVKTDFFDKEELERRMKIWNGVVPPMLEVDDVTRIISFICLQSKVSDIQDITVMPF